MPLKPAIRQQADLGVPTLVQDPNSDEARLYRDMARKIGAKVALLGKNYADKFPPIQVK